MTADGGTREMGSVIRGAVLGMVGTFVLFSGAALGFGQPLSNAAGIAILPTLFGGWYFGVLVPLSRLDLSRDPVAAPSRAAASTGTAGVGRPDGARGPQDDIAPAA